MSRYQPYPEYKDSGVEWIGEVPAHWEVVPGKALFLEKKEKNTDLAGGSYLSLVAGRGVIPYEEKGDIGNRKPDDLDRCKVVNSGDHVINSMNFSIGAYGRSRLSGVCSPVYVILSENSHRLCDGFGELILSNPSYQDFIQSFGSGILDHRRSIGWDEIKTAYVPCPPVQEQSQISVFTHRETARIDTLIEKKQRFIELLEEKRQAVITQAVTKGLDPDVPMKDSGVEWIGEVPAHWGVSTTGKTFEVTLGKMLQPSPKGSSDRMVPYHRTASVLWEDTLPVDELKEMWASESEIEFYSLRPGDLLICEGGDVGRAGVCREDVSTTNIIFQNSVHRVRQKSGRYDTTWLMYILEHAASTGWIDVICGKNTISHFTSHHLLNLRLPTPTFRECARILDFLDRETTRIDALIAKTRESIDLLKERRSALITAAVTGKIDVREEAA
jgi:type I restriction enzyme S subunit